METDFPISDQLWCYRLRTYNARTQNRLKLHEFNIRTNRPFPSTRPNSNLYGHGLKLFQGPGI